MKWKRIIKAAHNPSYKMLEERYERLNDREDDEDEASRNAEIKHRKDIDKVLIPKFYADLDQTLLTMMKKN